jgi:hypothetical protein
MNLSSAMRLVLFGILAFMSACEFAADKDVTFKLNSDDSLIYEIATDEFVLVAYQQKIKQNTPARIEVVIYAPDKRNLLTNADLHLTLINKGRRKAIKTIKSNIQGVYEATIELNFGGPSTFEFEVITPDFKSTAMIDQEILE